MTTFVLVSDGEVTIMKELKDTDLEKVTGGNGYDDPLKAIDEILGNNNTQDEDPSVVNLNPNLNFIFGDDIEIKM